MVAGSYIQKASEQLAKLQSVEGVVSAELNVARILNAASRDGEISSVARTLDDAIARGQTGLVFTSRAHFSGATKDETIGIAKSISFALVEVVRRIQVSPRFILAKGGITSSDTATRGLDVRRACVLGQIAPGVPVWQLGPESRFPVVPYVVFPGNVGTTDTLAGVIDILRG